mmetsp:Transcript_30057/g.49669  ORF Transcript_30057/g.49669 Transcript_30057/m.49669 type:complete len:83 (+) Transcript_30057:845-1093(+)
MRFEKKADGLFIRGTITTGRMQRHEPLSIRNARRLRTSLNKDLDQLNAGNWITDGYVKRCVPMHIFRSQCMRVSFNENPNHF